MQTSLKSLVAGLAAAAAFLIATPAVAVDYVGASFAAPSSGNDVVAYGSGAAQSFDINFGTLTEVTLAFTTLRDEVAPTMSFNALINNFAGYNFEGLVVRLTGGAFFTGPSGTVTPTFGSIGAINAGSAAVTTVFGSGEPYAVNFGNPLSQGGQSDWTIDFSAVQAGSTFGVTVTAVPEPGVYGMLLAGLGLIGAIARRRRA